MEAVRTNTQHTHTHRHSTHEKNTCAKHARSAHISVCKRNETEEIFRARARVRVCSGKPKRSASICSVPSPYSNVWCARMLYKLYSITCSAHILLRLDAYISWGLQESHCCHFDVAHIDFFFLGFIIGFSLKTCIRFLRSYGIWLWCCTVFVLCSVCVGDVWTLLPLANLFDFYDANEYIERSLGTKFYCFHVEAALPTQQQRQSRVTLCNPRPRLLNPRSLALYIQVLLFFFSFLMYFAFLELAKYQRTPPVCVCVYIYIWAIYLFCCFVGDCALLRCLFGCVVCRSSRCQAQFRRNEEQTQITHMHAYISEIQVEQRRRMLTEVLFNNNNKSKRVK